MITELIEASDEDRLLQVAYRDLRKLAEAQMQSERCDHTLQPTALVHEAYLRLWKTDDERSFHSRGQFFRAASEAMRRILVESARRRRSQKRGGDRNRRPLESDVLAAAEKDDQLLALHDALNLFAERFPEQAALVKLRCFVGMRQAEAADALEISRSTADRYWAFSKTWLFTKMQEPGGRPATST